MATISRTSRIGRALGARLYPGSAPAAHDHSRDRFIPTRQTPTEATAMMKNRLDVEIQRQELRRATRRALYPGVLLLSVLLLAAPVGINAAVDAYDRYQQQRAQEKAQAEREAERERLREERQAAADAAPSEGDTSEPSGVLQPPTTTGPPDNPFESSQQPQFPPAPGSQGQGADAFGSSPFPPAPGSNAVQQGGQQ